MRIVTPLDPLSHLGVILDLADVEVPGEPSIMERAGTFVAVSVMQRRSTCARPLWWWRHWRDRSLRLLWSRLLCARPHQPHATSAAQSLRQRRSFCAFDHPDDAVGRA